MKMKLKLFTLIGAVMILFAVPAFAMDLLEARTSGKVGELNTGYVQALVSSSEVEALVADVNNRRGIEYKKISMQNGQSADVVAKIAAEKIIENLPSGAKYQDAGGSWQTK